jgi:alpha-ketoglutarate-dependent taurine dioxygenase
LNTSLDDPNLAVRWHWTAGDIAIWDESCTVHRSLVDHYPAFRCMRRCTTTGDSPLPFVRA